MKVRCIVPTHFAFLLAPTELKIAVTQVPIFCPMIMNTAAFVGTSPADARESRIPCDAEELWIIAVTPAPTRIPRKGLEPIEIKAVLNTSDSLKG